MAQPVIRSRTRRAAWYASAALVAPFALVAAAGAQTTTAQSGSAQPLPPSAAAQTTGVAEIVVTAQKRSQNMQDVPISVSALNTHALEANRITNAIDLGGTVPNLAARATGGGALLPAFTMRGITSYGVVPGSDKEISIYLDGVYIGSTVGSAIDLPEVAQIEVLRGPQGTLFGRNSTGGAINVTTRDPGDKFGVDQTFTAGNYDEFRSKTRVDTGSFGDFSASFTYLHDQRRGDVRNLGAGTVWTFPTSAGIPTTQVSPKWLGDKNVNTVFAALKYQRGDLRIVNKFDWTGQDYTPPASAAVGYNPGTLGPAGGAFFGGIIALQTTPPLLDPSATRPHAVNNSFTLPAYVRDWGDSLTATYQLSDHLTVKNILAYRNSYLRESGQLGGLGDLVITPAIQQAFGFPASYIGAPFVTYGIEQVQTAKQWSDELQANYNSRLVTVTAGLLYFHLKTTNGGRPGYPNNLALEAVPGGDIGALNAPSGEAFNAARSLAAYAQAEVHVTSQLDLVAGFRETNDRKTGQFDGAQTVVFNKYDRTLPSYSAGINYKPTHDILLYGKFSHANVSGGSAGTVVFNPEFADSAEAGIKSEFFNHRLRANLALYTVLYRHIQAASAGINVGHPELGLVVVDQGTVRAKGFEFESTFVPVRNFTLGAAVGYTSVKDTYDNPASNQGATDSNGTFIPATLSNFFPTLQPKWTLNLSGEYDTQPIMGDATMSFRVDASWRDKELTDPFLVYQEMPQYASLKYSPATWLVNARIALNHVKLPVGEGQIAIWARNLNNAKESVFPDIFGFVGTTEFQQARTFGVDVNFKY